MYVVVWLLNKDIPTIWPLLLTMLIQVFFAVMWSYFVHRWYFATFPPRRTAILYGVRPGMERLIHEYGLEKKFSIVKTEDIHDCLQSNLEMLQDMQAVFLCGIHSHERNIVLKYCIARDIQVYMLPRIGDVLMSSAKPLHLFHLPMMQVTRYEPVPEYVMLKRLFDIFVSGVALIVLSPVFLAVSIAIKIYDGGPVFYKQCRLTKDGKTFMVHKFRSMKVDAEKDGVARLSTGDKDDRVTPVGHFIRKVRLDELPQLLDILKGDMSLVGPRPERPEIAAQYEKELPEFALRLQAKAGLTGYAQVYGKYNTTPLRQIADGPDVYRPSQLYGGSAHHLCDGQNPVCAREHRGRGRGPDHGPERTDRGKNGGKGMKVLLLANDSTYVYNLRREVIEAMLAKGWQVAAACDRKQHAEELEQMGCRLLPLEVARHGKNPLQDLALLRSYGRLLDVERPDVVLTYNIKPNVYGGMACAKRGIPYLVNVCGLGTPVENPGPMQVLTVALYKRGVKKAACVFMRTFSMRAVWRRATIICCRGPASTPRALRCCPTRKGRRWTSCLFPG